MSRKERDSDYPAPKINRDEIKNKAEAGNILLNEELASDAALAHFLHTASVFTNLDSIEAIKRLHATEFAQNSDLNLAELLTKYSEHINAYRMWKSDNRAERQKFIDICLNHQHQLSNVYNAVLEVCGTQTLQIHFKSILGKRFNE
jgi:fibronectin type 3 domain-containing protein